MSAFEKHYSINELAELWGFSPGLVRTIFRERSDVLSVDRKETRDKRCYRNIRVPESVAEKVYSELSKKRR